MIFFEEGLNSICRAYRGFFKVGGDLDRLWQPQWDAKGRVRAGIGFIPPLHRPWSGGKGVGLSLTCSPIGLTGFRTGITDFPIRQTGFPIGLTSFQILELILFYFWLFPSCPSIHISHRKNRKFNWTVRLMLCSLKHYTETRSIIVRYLI